MKKIIFIALALLSVFVASAQTPGSLDTTFGNGGKVDVVIEDYAFGLSIGMQADQKVIMGGFSVNPSFPVFALLRLNTDGSLDNSFGLNGIVFNNNIGEHYGKEVLVQPDGKIILVGEVYNSMQSPPQDISISRYDQDGSVDVSFGSNGIIRHDLAITYEEVNTAALQADGKIVLGGFVQGDLSGAFIARFNPNGSIDNTFNNDGYMLVEEDIYSSIKDIVILPDGRILAVGKSDESGQWGDPDGSDIMLLRFNPDGSLDPSFDNDGKVITSITGSYIEASGVDLQTDGKIVISGNHFISSSVAEFIIARYNINGSIDNSFGVNGMQIISFNGGYETSNSIVIQPGGDILVGGGIDYGLPTQRFALACFTPSGDLDLQFDNDGKVETNFSGQSNDAIQRLLLQPDGKVVAGGYAKAGGVTSFALARYHTGNFLGNPEYTGSYNLIPMKLYPNPSSDIINVEFQLTSGADVTIQITDITGRILNQQLYTGEASEGNNFQSINLPSSLSAGIYVLTLITNNGSSSVQFVKN